MSLKDFVDDVTEHAMTKEQKQMLDETLDANHSVDVGWKPDREATELAIREMILTHPTEFERLLRKYHEQSDLEFRSTWLDRVKTLQFA